MTASIDNETEFEKHFCHQLDIHGNGKYRIKKFTDIKNLIIDDLCLYFQELEDFLNSTQLDKLTQYKSAMGSSWKDSLQQKIREEFSSKPLFQVLKNGISHNNFYFDLLYFQPSNESNQNAQGLYEKNRFTAIRQYHFGEESQRESLDIALALNGFVIVTIELKNQGTSGTIQDAIEQYLRRNINLPIFQKPFLHIVCDNFKVKIAAAFSKPPSEKDFRDFNKDLINIPPNNREYPVHYLYQDILLPDRILNFIEKFLYVGGDNKWIFPRYHQQRVTKNITEEIKSHFLKTNQLDLKYLIQHSTGSGKSNTIVWLVQNLRTLHANGKKIFSSVVVLTDRLNLDDQISRDFQKAILSEGIASYIDSTEDLRIALETNKQVIISTIQKFTYLKDLSLKSNKRICILIDEAHRSQEGKLHESVTQTFQSDENGIEDVPIEDVAEKVGDEIEKKRFPNLVFIALTATPSDKTLNHFGKEVRDKSTVRHEPHDVYSMKQAIEEGYILDVVKHVYTYDTLYYLNKKLESSKEYPPQLVNRGIRLKVYEDDLIIQDKCERIAKLFHIHSSSKINGKSKAMIVTSSRLAAVKYKTYLDIELKKNKYPYESLVAFTGTVSWISKDEQGNERSENYTEDGMNSSLNPKNEKTERLFERDPNIRFLIVANKFQTGFNEPLLHTMFLDKPVRDKSAVQTLSRLNRIYPGKNDTLVVDFTGSYDQIMKAYNKYQGDVVSHFNPNPDDLIEIKNALLRFGIFTESDVKEIGSLILKKESIHLFIGLISTVIEKFKSSLTEEQRNEFRTLMIRFIGLYNYINNLYKMPNNDLIHYQLFLILLSKKMDNQDYSSLKKELESVFVQHYDVIAKDIPDKKEEVNGDREGERVRNSGGATSVKKLKTVQQVVLEINEKFMKRVGKVGMNIIEEFMNKVSQDINLQEIIKNNINNQFDIVYTDIMKPKLLNLYHELILNKAPDEYEILNSEDIVNEVFHKAYDYIRDNIKVA